MGQPEYYRDTHNTLAGERSTIKRSLVGWFIVFGVMLAVLAAALMTVPS